MQSDSPGPLVNDTSRSTSMGPRGVSNRFESPSTASKRGQILNLLMVKIQDLTPVTEA